MEQTAILVERDFKGKYERFALTPKEFMEEYPEVFQGKPFCVITDADTCTLSPLVHLWYKPCIVGDREWRRFFTDMEWGIPTIDTEVGNCAYVRVDLMKSLLPCLPENTVTEESTNSTEKKPRHKIKITETREKTLDIEAPTKAEAIEKAIKLFYDLAITTDESDLRQIQFQHEEEHEK